MGFFLNIINLIKYFYLSKDQRQITFYSEGKNYWPHLEGLVLEVLEKSKFKVCYVSSKKDDPGLFIKHSRLKTFIIGDSYVRDHFFQNLDTRVLVMTMPDLGNFRVKRSHNNVHYVYVQHSIVSLHMIYREGAFNNYDTICAVGYHHVNEIRKIEEKYNLPKKNIIELGYSRLDSLIKKNHIVTKTNKIKEKIHKKILIAPSWGPNGIIESGLGESLTTQLLDLGHEVVIRPHPETIRFAKDQIEKIKRKHVNNKMFSFERDIVGDESLYSSDIMISDWSGVALEYAFALKKPVIFCDLPRKINNKNYLEIEIDPIEVSIRSKVGLIWDGISPISESIKISSQKNKNDLNALIDQYCFNLGYSDKIFVEFCQSFI
tara:strand:- start:6234 stop:7358 length:1125 start_codon:yes stop_codon:yes gene_type:complete